MMSYFFNSLFITCDAPKPWGVYFQDSTSPQMEALVELHDNIMFYLVIILFGVAWIMVSIIRNYVYSKSPISNKYLNHGTLIELIWTITPALILILIAFPSFKLLYLMDEVTDPSITVFVAGHQWYWSYQYPDFINDDNEELEFDSYLVPKSEVWDILTILSESSEEGRSPSIQSLDENDYPDTSNINNCEHDNWSPYPLGEDGIEEQNNIDELLCDFGASDETQRHKAFPEDYEGLHDTRRPEVCNNCHAIRCNSCYVEY